MSDQTKAIVVGVEPEAGLGAGRIIHTSQAPRRDN
jgi:hypothetical protein